MKGLLVKDFKLILLQKKFLLIVFVTSMGMIAVKEDMTFWIAFLSFYLSILVLSTISYDDFDNGNAFLFTLPVTRHQYVVEKYALGLLCGCMAWMTSTAVGISTILWKNAVNFADFMTASLFILPVVIVMQAIMLPVQLKFGGEKGRIVMIAVFGGIAVIGFAVEKGAEAVFHMEAARLLNNLPTVSMGVVFAGTMLIVLFLLFVSIKSSLAIMSKKEF